MRCISCMGQVSAIGTLLGGWRQPTTAARFTRLGIRAGVPDIVLHLGGGLTAFLELKAASGLSPEHQRFMRDVEAIGCLTAVAYGVDQALEILREWNTIRRPVG